MTLSITDTQHNNALHYAECYYAECHSLFVVMLSVIMMNVVILNVIMLNVVMLSVMAPYDVMVTYLCFYQGIRYLTGDSLKVVLAEFSTLI